MRESSWNNGNESYSPLLFVSVELEQEEMAITREKSLLYSFNWIVWNCCCLNPVESAAQSMKQNWNRFTSFLHLLVVLEDFEYWIEMQTRTSRREIKTWNYLMMSTSFGSFSSLLLVGCWLKSLLSPLVWSLLLSFFLYSFNRLQTRFLILNEDELFTLDDGDEERGLIMKVLIEILDGVAVADDDND